LENGVVKEPTYSQRMIEMVLNALVSQMGFCGDDMQSAADQDKI
jgi:hypothetical protein